MGKIFNSANISSKTPIVIFVLLFLVTYWRVPLIFFVQDEWQGFGLIIYNGLNIILRGLGDNQVFHFIPINNAINFVTFHLFNLNSVGYLAIGLILHLVNGFLVYKIGQKLIGNNYFALLAGILFITSNSASQLVMWPVVSMNTLALTFSLLGWLTIYRYEFQRNALLIGTVATVLIVCAFLTVEYSVGLILFIPILFVLNMKSKKMSESGKFLIPFLLISLVYIGIRISPFLAISGGTGGEANSNLLATLIYKGIRYPFRYLGEIMIPEVAILTLEDFISKLLNSPAQNLFSKISVVAGIILFFCTVVTAFYKKTYKKELFIIMLFIFSSVLPFLIVPGVAGSFIIFPPRYLYFGLAGGALLLAYLAYIVSLKGSKSTIIVNGLMLAIISSSIFFNWIQSNELSIKSEERKQILNVIKASYPVLPKKVIFYTESDESFYGLPEAERILPFQSGFGQTLLVWYYQTEKFPRDFYKDKFLWAIKDQSYKEVNGRGFGYFRDFDLLTKTISENNLDYNSIISFHYDSKTHNIEDNTNEVRGRLSGYFVRKETMDLANISIFSSYNNDAIHFAIDNDRNTYWDSVVPYTKPQSLVIDLRGKKQVVQIDIDSYNNKDQNKVGYAIFLSEDNINWKQVFFSKVYPPGKDGILYLYFKPQKAQYIRIEQRGYHEFASWVIHELKIYEEIH